MTLRIDKILVPTDFSDCARVALDQALALARRHDAEVHFLHVMLSHDEDPYSLVYQLADRHSIYEQQVGICRDAMAEILAERAVEVVSRKGHPARGGPARARGSPSRSSSSSRTPTSRPTPRRQGSSWPASADRETRDAASWWT